MGELQFTVPKAKFHVFFFFPPYFSIYITKMGYRFLLLLSISLSLKPSSVAARDSSDDSDKDGGGGSSSRKIQCWSGIQIGVGKKFNSVNFPRHKICKGSACTREWIPQNGANSPEQLILDCLEKADWRNYLKNDFGRNYKKTKGTKCAEKKFNAEIFKANGKSLRENIQAKRCICFQERCNAKDLEDSGVDAFYSTSFATRLLIALCFILSRV